MSKQLITLLGVLLTVAVLAVAVMVGVIPLTAGVLGAYAQRQLVASTNADYEAQIAALEQQAERIGEIEESVAGLRARIPAAEQLNEVFERIARAEESAGVQVVSVTRGDLVPYAVRTGTGDDPVPAPAATPPAAETPAADGSVPDPSAPIDAAQGVADAAGGQGDAVAAPVASSRSQVELSIAVTALDIGSAFAFIDALREGPRAIAVDKAVVTGSPGAFDVQVTALAFIQTDGGE
ncbi:hypothetical protein [Microbacterium hydrocarbonoxydans]|uniref:hypothetical protein n=1 Tax=Microbacterium hydrocarbonoxydans TaxID=273678 RepID=UPI0007BB89AC|nr:hypothetical protein [Microbacterium hydrocarbonoxydans]GAT71635.1 hypothetical protein MHM582_0099 [Microbacterium sp. HM58-2]